MAQDTVIKIPLQMTTLLYDYFHVVAVPNVKKCGDPTISVCYKITNPLSCLPTVQLIDHAWKGSLGTRLEEPLKKVVLGHTDLNLCICCSGQMSFQGGLVRRYG